MALPPNTSATADGPATMQAPTAAPDAAPAAAAARTTGLDTPFKSVGASKKRAAPVMMPLRTGKIWATVTVVGQEMSQTPNVVCKDCGRTFCGGNTRIVALPHQVQGARAARPRQVGQARLLPRGAPPEGGRRRRSTPATRRWWRSGTPTRTAPTARTTSSTWPSRARAASCEARGSEGGRGVRVRDTEGEVSGSCIHTIHSSVGG